jgi:hypothetical protein
LFPFYILGVLTKIGINKAEMDAFCIVENTAGTIT